MPNKLHLLDPSNDLSYTYRRKYIDNFFYHYVPEIPPNSLVLDLGGQKIIKRGKFNINEFNLHVVCANLSVSKGTDVINDAISLPFMEESFDAVICAELLEHVFKPELVLREIYRVLKIEGKLLVTVPFLYRIHADPDDFGRYTNTFWWLVLNEVGYRDIKIEKQGFYYSVLADFIKQYVVEHPSPPILGRIYNQAVKLIIKRMIAAEQKTMSPDNSFLQSFTTGFGIITKK